MIDTKARMTTIERQDGDARVTLLAMEMRR